MFFCSIDSVIYEKIQEIGMITITTIKKVRALSAQLYIVIRKNTEELDFGV